MRPRGRHLPERGQGASIRRPIRAVLMEQNEEWQLQHRYLPQHTMSENSAETRSNLAAQTAA